MCGQAEDTAFVGGGQAAEGLGVEMEPAFEGVSGELYHQVVAGGYGGETCANCALECVVSELSYDMRASFGDRECDSLDRVGSSGRPNHKTDRLIYVPFGSPVLEVGQSHTQFAEVGYSRRQGLQIGKLDADGRPLLDPVVAGHDYGGEGDG